MVRTKPIFNYLPIPEKIQTGEADYMEFQGVLKKEHADIPGSSKKGEDFLAVIRKKSCGSSMVLGFLVVKFPRGVTQFSGISKSESLFSKGKVTNL